MSNARLKHDKMKYPKKYTLLMLIVAMTARSSLSSMALSPGAMMQDNTAGTVLTSSISNNCTNEAQAAMGASQTAQQNATGVVAQTMKSDVDPNAWDFSTLLTDCLSQIENMFSANFSDPINMLVNAMIQWVMNQCNTEVNKINTTMNNAVSQAWGSIPGVSSLNNLNVGNQALGPIISPPSLTSGGPSGGFGVNASLTGSQVNNNFMPQSMQKSLNATANGTFNYGASGQQQQNNNTSAVPWSSIFSGTNTNSSKTTGLFNALVPKSTSTGGL